MTILTKSLKEGKKAFGLITKIILLTLLVLITCSCSGLKLTLAPQIIENQIEFSLYSGKPVKQIKDVMECAILKTDALVSPLWHRQNLYIKQQYLQTQGLAYFQNQELMLRKCLPTKSYLCLSTTRSFLNQYRTVWIVQKQN